MGRSEEISAHFSKLLKQGWRLPGASASRLCWTATLFNRSDHVQFAKGPPISAGRGSHVTFRDPIPSHHWRQEERHDQMGTAEMAWEVRAGVELRRQLYARHDRGEFACRMAVFSRRRARTVPS